MKRINIMTTCDDRIAKYILPQLASINKNLSKYDVHFYLVHTRISPENVHLIKSFAEDKTAIIMHEIIVDSNTSFYESLVESGGGQWPQEAYYTLRAQDYLPEDVDRIMYIDAGDVIIDGDIGPYYFDDFEEKSIIATPLSFKTDPETKEVTLHGPEDMLTIKGGSLFNSGSWVLDVEKFRKDGYSVNDYLYLAGQLVQNTKPGELAYFGDQGFLAAAFAGDVKFFGYPEHKTPAYMPYNFRSAYWALFQGEPDYEPVVLHYALISKPWIVRFTDEVIDRVIAAPDFVGKQLVTPIPSLAFVTPQHFRLGEVWWKYAEETPIYKEADIRARAIADCWEKHYIPMCDMFNRAMHHINQK